MKQVSTAEVCGKLKLSEPARALVSPHSQPLDFVRELLAKDLTKDAVRFLAHFLPKRTAVWWGCLCTWHVQRPSLAEHSRAGLGAAVRWARDPSEKQRQEAHRAGTAAGIKDPAGALALAAARSGGSLSPPALPVVPPPPDMTAKTVVVAVLGACVLDHPPCPADRRRQFVQLALDVVAGKGFQPDGHLAAKTEGHP
jgi:hypothetical protein